MAGEIAGVRAGPPDVSMHTNSAAVAAFLRLLTGNGARRGAAAVLEALSLLQEAAVGAALKQG